MDDSTVIIFLAVLAVLFAYVTVMLVREARNNARWKRITDSLRGPIDRRQQLDKSMEKLVTENPVIDKLDDAFSLIDKYAVCKDSHERKHCRDYLTELYYRGYERYDDERMK